MDELSKEYVISFYSKALQMHGDRPESLRSTSQGQRLHYEGLLDIKGSLHGKKILDYGCGKGDFYQFLKDKGISVRYTGFDFNERLISLARKKFPSGKFRVFDAESDLLDEDFDYIFLYSVFNLKVKGAEQTIKNTLINLFNHCRIALAFNALSAYDPQKDFELHYIYPEELLDFSAKNLSPFTEIGHERLPYDFTMFVYKN